MISSPGGPDLGSNTTSDCNIASFCSQVFFFRQYKATKLVANGLPWRKATEQKSTKSNGRLILGLKIVPTDLLPM